MFRQRTYCAVCIALTIVVSFFGAFESAGAQPTVDMETVARFGGFISAGAVQGDYAFITQGVYFTLLDISGAEPVQVSYLELPELSFDMFISGDYAYLFLTDDAGFYIINISDPLNPAIEGNCDLPVGISQNKGIHVTGNYAYVANGTEGLKVIDVSNPSNPGVVATVARNYTDVFLQGNYAYAIEYIPVWDSKLWVIDISDPENPVERGSCDTKSSQSVTVAGDYAYLAENNNPRGMRVVDISDPDNPTSEAFFTTTDGSNEKFALQVAVHENYAYVSPLKPENLRWTLKPI